MPDLSKLIHQFVMQMLPPPSAGSGQTPAGRLFVAFSGGLDSTVLLHVLAHLPLRQPLGALHINHQLSPNARGWTQHCQSFAEHLGVPLSVELVTPNSNGQGLEQAAREARYQSLAAHLTPGDLLLTGHHLQDQAETVLLRLARGSGWHGLGAMVPLRALGAGWLGRPLLTVDRAHLLTYAQKNELSWVEDESNQTEDFDRNYLRHQVVPQFTRRWPQFDQSVTRCAGLLREADQLLHTYALEDLNHLGLRSERIGHSCIYQPLLDWPALRRNHVLRTLLRRLTHQAPPQRQLDLLWQAVQAAPGRHPRLRWGTMEVRRFQQRLYFLPSVYLDCPPPKASVTWDLAEPLTLADASCLSATPSTEGLRADRTYQIAWRAGRLRAQPQGRRHSQTLKKLLYAYRLEPWLRNRVPLLFDGDQLAAVGDLWVEQGYWVEHGSGPAVTLHWSYPEQDL